ncbi:MAG: GNAT family N-acetyltransferase [Paludibacterium sp.]|uniref:GNAT family N-acetyltransferase n=1 Tax=Paludibacterium sp. TaxID=1917523 RepID=UPI0025D319D0|nr:GNAT family N-acetyltransferase [Paludibacterium sp.]MBV8048062.1 GNAT family N-acetyltransferase [Paludibacterium sp.]MBV8646945.1 GNAT family N-acetyltransferase [Paludibacterium sp.]
MMVLPLNDRHDRNHFDCGDVDLNGWLKRIAKQHKEKGVSSTFVAVADEQSTEVLGFYAISLAELVNTDLPTTYKKRLPVKVPVFRLGRLATAILHRRKGIGEYMLFDAIDRVTRIAREVGGIGLVVNAKHAAVNFYQRYGFEPMADHPQHLFLPI